MNPSPARVDRPGLLARIATRSGRRARSWIEERTTQRDDFIEMIDGATTAWSGPVRVIAGALPDRRFAFHAGGWFRSPAHRLRHLLDCYSCTLRWRVGPEGADLVVEPVDDPLRTAEMKAGRILRKGFFTALGTRGPRRITHVVGRRAIHDVVCWNGSVIQTTHGAWYAIDPETLAPRPDPLAPLGLHPSTVRAYNNHPQIEPGTGRLLTHVYEIGPTFTTRFTFAEIDPDGTTTRRTYRWPRLLTPHAFGFTGRYFVVPDIAARYRQLRFVLGVGEGLLRDTIDQPDRGIEIHLVHRRGGEDVRVRFALPGYVYHLLNCFDRDDGTVVVDAYVTNLNPEREASQFELDGHRPVWTNVGALYRFEIDPGAGTARKAVCVPDVHRVAFDAIDERRRGLPYRFGWLAANDQHEGRRSEVLRVDVETGAVDRWVTDARLFLRQPRVVPGEREGTGLLVVPAYTAEDARLLIFDAARIADGPTCVLSAGRRIPYCNHGCVQPLSEGPS